MSWGCHHATDGGSVAEVGVRVQDNLGDAGRGPAVLDLPHGGVAKGFSNTIVTDDGDGLSFAFGSGDESCGRAGDVNR